MVTFSKWHLGATLFLFSFYFLKATPFPLTSTRIFFFFFLEIILRVSGPCSSLLAPLGSNKSEFFQAGRAYTSNACNAFLSSIKHPRERTQRASCPDGHVQKHSIISCGKINTFFRHSRKCSSPSRHTETNFNSQSEYVLHMLVKRSCQR